MILRNSSYGIATSCPNISWVGLVRVATDNDIHSTDWCQLLFVRVRYLEQHNGACCNGGGLQGAGWRPLGGDEQPSGALPAEGEIQRRSQRGEYRLKMIKSQIYVECLCSLCSVFCVHILPFTFAQVPVYCQLMLTVIS